MKTKLKYILTASLSLFFVASFGHDVPVHWAITLNAAMSAYNDSSDFRDFISTVSSDLSYAGPFGITNAMKDGSGFEDHINLNPFAGTVEVRLT